MGKIKPTSSTEGKKVKELSFYRKLSSYGHSQLTVSIPKDYVEFLKKDTIYLVTLKEN